MALKVNFTLTSLNLRGCNIGAEGSQDGASGLLLRNVVEMRTK